MVFSSELLELVLTGTSGSLRDQPRPFMESRKEAEVMLLWSIRCVTLVGTDAEARSAEM